MIDKEKIFWSFIDDLTMLGSDVKAHVLYGGCRWGEPSLIPGIVERLSKLDYRMIENIFPAVICNDMAKTRLRSEVDDIFNYHIYDLDLDYSDVGKVALYAGWLNRFILICSKFGMNDVIPLTKQEETDTGGDNGIEAKEIPGNIVSLFKPTFRANGLLDKSSRDVAKEYLGKVLGCSLSQCAHVYNEEYGAKGKAITGTEWGRRKHVLYECLTKDRNRIIDKDKKQFARLLK